MFVNQKLYIDT